MCFIEIFPVVKSATRRVRILGLISAFIPGRSPSCVRGKIVGGVSADRTNLSGTIEDTLERNRTCVLFVEGLLAVRITDLLT